MTSKILECTNKQARENVLEAALLGVSASASAEVQQHLEACASCAEEWKQFGATMTLLDEWDVPEPSPYFDTRLRARLREEAQAPASFWQRVFEPFTHGWRAVGAAALGVALLVGGILLGTGVLNQPKEDAACPVVDVQSLDHNANVIQEMNAIDQSVPDDDNP